MFNSQIYVNDQHIQFGVLSSFDLPDGRVLKRYRQFYEDVPIWGETLTVSTSPEALLPHVYGEVISSISDDLSDIRPLISPHRAKLIALADRAAVATRDYPLLSEFESTDSYSRYVDDPLTLWVYLDQDLRACLVYLVSWSMPEEANIRFFTFVDAKNGRVIEHWDELVQSEHFM